MDGSFLGHTRAHRRLVARPRNEPEFLALLGFELRELTSGARYTFPSLTTISPDMGGIARLAVAQLLDRLNGNERNPASRSVEYRLVVREGTAGRPVSVGVRRHGAPQ
jgi:DNA-binding LacI/PurR family transcriptional regulator